MLPLKIQLRSNNQVFKFIVVGGLNTIIGMSVIFILIYMGIDNYIANLSGYILGLIIGFFLHKYYTFENNNKPTFIEVLKFVLTFIISYSINMIILYFALFYIDSYLAQILAMLGYTIINYLLNKFITFKKIL